MERSQQLKQLLIEALKEYHGDEQNHKCFLTDEEKQILKDFIQVGHIVKRAVLVSIAYGSFGLGFFGLAIWVGLTILNKFGLAG